MNHVLGAGQADPPGKGQFLFGGCSPLKCIILRKQQTPQQHEAADLSTGAARHGESSASEWTHPPQGVTSAGGAIRAFVKIL